MADKLLQKDDYRRGEQIVRWTCPDLFAPLDELLDQFAERKQKGSSELPEGAEQEIQACFKKICRRIRRDTEERLEGRKAGLPKAGSADDLDDFKRHVYTLVRDMRKLGWWPCIEALVHRKEVGRRPKRATTKRFTEVLRYITQTSKSERGAFLSVKKLGDIANQLAYALNHDVPLPFLIGFLKDVGIEEAARKQRAELYEEWHPNWKPSTEEHKKPKVGKTKAKSKKTSSSVGEAGEDAAKSTKTSPKTGKAHKSSRKATM